MLSRSGRTAILCATVAALWRPGVARAESPAQENPLQWHLYGFLNAELEQVQATGGPTPFGRRFRVSDGNSRLGFAGSWSFLQSAKALWQIEGSLNAFEQGGVNDKGLSAILVSRNTFVGFEEARFGRLTLGYSDSAYRSLIGSGGELGGNLGLTTVGLDVWNNTSAQMTGNPDSIFSRGEARYKNSVHYFSPDWMVRFAASASVDEAVANGSHRDRFAAALRFKMDGVQVGAGIDYQLNTGVNADQLQQGLGLRVDGEPGVATYYYKVVATYTAPTHTFIGAGWERSNYGFSQFIPASDTTPFQQTRTGTMRQDAFMVSLAQTVDEVTVGASAAMLRPLDNPIFFAPDDFKALQFSLGVKYDFNEHFAAYAYGTYVKNEAQQNVNLGQAPLYSNGAGTGDAYLAPGNDPRAFGVGLIARF